MKKAKCEEDTYTKMMLSHPVSYAILVQSMTPFSLADLVNKLIAAEVRKNDLAYIDVATALFAGKATGRSRKEDLWPGDPHDGA